MVLSSSTPHVACQRCQRQGQDQTRQAQVQSNVSTLRYQENLLPTLFCLLPALLRQTGPFQARQLPTCQALSVLGPRLRARARRLFLEPVTRLLISLERDHVNGPLCNPKPSPGLPNDDVLKVRLPHVQQVLPPILRRLQDHLHQRSWTTTVSTNSSISYRDPV